MAKGAGRTLLIKKNAVTIAGIRSVSVKVGREWIDVTDNDSGIFRELLAGTEAQATLTIQCSGLSSETTLKAIGMSATAGAAFLTDITMVDPTEAASADILSGNFAVTEYEIKGEYQGAIEFSCTLESSGAWARA
jgi:TP901-1 family phage major tail protein